MPHGLKIDTNGNIWVTDVGRHQVLKFKPDDLSNPALSAGTFMEPGNDRTHFCKPADVAVLKSGEFFVADGYCNARIVKFSSTGQYVDEWWSYGDKTKPSKFRVCHSITVHEASNRLCVADRENSLVQCFDLSGKFLFETELNKYGAIYSVAFAANDGSVLYAINAISLTSESKVVLISTSTGKVIGTIDIRSRDLQSDISRPHTMSVNDDGTEIYIGSLEPEGIFKFKLLQGNSSIGMACKYFFLYQQNPRKVKIILF
jgi:hypothetical protein